jgi:NADPH:quinone reductase
MKAVRYHEKGEPEVLVYEEVPDPVPASGQVLLRVLAAGVNYADTVRRRGGNYPRPTPLPFTPGSEVVGVIEKLGPGVVNVTLGATVIAWLTQGGYAELAVADAAGLLPVPAGVKPAEALSLIIQGLSAALILKKSARLQAGESVLVEGAAGGVGVLAVQLAKIYGAGKVIGAASTKEKRELVLSLGADAAVDYTQPDWPARVKVENGGQPVDVILEMTGGAVFEQSFACLAPVGRMVA